MQNINDIERELWGMIHEYGKDYNLCDDWIGDHMPQELCKIKDGMLFAKDKDEYNEYYKQADSLIEKWASESEM